MKYPSETLAVFARYPQPGSTKTRLAPLLGPEGAALAYRRIAEMTAREAARLDRCGLDRVVWVEPGSRLAEASLWLGSHFRYRGQRDGDLGVRLAAAFDAAFASGAARVVAIGTDCPGLDSAVLRRAFDDLTSHDAVLGPAADGGYYLLGLTRPVPGVFERIPWSTAQVASLTLQLFSEQSLSVSVLDVLQDLDTPDDFTALVARWPELLGDLGPSF